VEAAMMAKNNKKCPECNGRIAEDEIYFVAQDEDGDYGIPGELFRFHPNCWAQGECLGQLKEHTRWLIGLTTATLNTLRTEYSPTDVPECVHGFMPELDQALAGLSEEADLLRSIAATYQGNQPA
jgi:hypothetical protein